MSSDWSQGLFSCGPCGSCMYACCCSSCAIAQSRSNMDGSSCCYNFCCFSAADTRWVVREAYGIPGGAWTDCFLSICCGGCVANQMYQTSQKLGLANGARVPRTNLWAGDCCASLTCMNLLKAGCCMPCVNASVMQQAIGKPWCFTCLCSNNVASNRNLLRHHYRVQGDDFGKDCLPFCLPYASCCFLAHNISEVEKRTGKPVSICGGGGAATPYLSGAGNGVN